MMRQLQMNVKMKRFSGESADKTFSRFLKRELPVIERYYRSGEANSIEREIILWYF